MSPIRENAACEGSMSRCACLGDGQHRRGATSDADKRFVAEARAEAVRGLREGGVPIAAVLVGADGQVLGRGRNQRVQQGSPILHGETACLANCGRLTASVYRGATLYTTLSPCHLCAGAVLLYQIPRVVVSENRSFLGAEHLLESHGVEVVVVDDADTYGMFQRWMQANPRVWNEDIGLPPGKL